MRHARSCVHSRPLLSAVLVFGGRYSVGCAGLQASVWARYCAAAWRTHSGHGRDPALAGRRGAHSLIDQAVLRAPSRAGTPSTRALTLRDRGPTRGQPFSTALSPAEVAGD